MSARKLWKVISISKKGSRISKSLTYGDAFEKFTKYRAELQEGDRLYMIQILEIAVGRETLSVDHEEIDVGAASGWLQAAGVGG